MRWTRTVAVELVSLVIDDGQFAAIILMWLAFNAGLIRLSLLSGDKVVYIFVIGLIAILIENVWAYSRHKVKK